MSDAPLYADLAESPQGGRAAWVEAADGVRLRIAWWDEGRKGTVLIFPGRTEFIEKYGRTAADFRERGYASVAIDWRGQGLSDRLVPNRALGHVGTFDDYQLDVTALLTALRAQGLPEPYYLCAHSMGGTIGLRALVSGLPVRKSVFSAPMWGLTIPTAWRPIVQAVALGSRSVGLGQEFAPGTTAQNYLTSAEYKDNTLTSSEESWDYMRRMVQEHPGLEIGGPSIHWLHEALIELKALSRHAPPDSDGLCLIGSDEKVVDRRDIITYMEKWPRGQVSIVTGARHEILMEMPAIRKRALDMIDTYLQG
jgi:lysophospholipase